MSYEIKKRPSVRDVGDKRGKNTEKAAKKESPESDSNGDLQKSLQENDLAYSDNTWMQICYIVLIFVFAIGLLSVVYFKFPEMSSADKEKFKLPRNLDDAKDLGKVLSNYKDDFYLQVIFGFMVTYIFLNAFAIPGSIFLSILSGFLFPFPLAIFLVCMCTSIGSSLCYIISAAVGKKLVMKYLPERIKEWQKHVDHHRKDILNYIIFLRITPFLPNWFINITSPVLNVPILQFFMGTFIGVAPPSFAFISAGFELYELTATGDAFSFTSISLIIVAAVVSLLPVVFRKKMQEKLE